jgi:hypothetical protein
MKTIKILFVLLFLIVLNNSCEKEIAQINVEESLSANPLQISKISLNEIPEQSELLSKIEEMENGISKSNQTLKDDYDGIYVDKSTLTLIKADDYTSYTFGSFKGSISRFI